jgi:hypothetical protein
MCTVDATEFTLVCFWTELQLFLVRKKYHSLESLYKFCSVLYFCSFNQEALITFYASLLVSLFFEFHKLAWNLANVFDSTYTCEQAFHIWNKINQSSVQELLMCTHMMWCEMAFQKWNQMLILMQSKHRPKFHINKVSLGYFYHNIQFCVGYGREIWMLRHLQHIISFNVAHMPKRLSTHGLHTSKHDSINKKLYWSEPQ